MLGHDVDHAPTDKMKAGLFFLSKRYARNKDAKIQKRSTLVLKKKKGFPFLHMRSKYEVKISHIEHRKNGRGITEMPFSPYFVEITDSKMESFFGNISSWVANWEMKLISMPFLYLQHFLHQISPWSGTTIFMRIQCAKVGAFEFSRIYRRDRVVEKNTLEFFIYIFLHVQCCVRVSASSFQFSSPNS